MTDCEWMYGDAATGLVAEVDPLRWSGSAPIHEAIDDIAREISKHGEDRPIIVKCPSGVTSHENRFNTSAEAIAFLLSKRAGALKLTVVSARGLRDADVLPWAGKSDPYVKVEIDGKGVQFQTPVKNDTKNPVWNHTNECFQFSAGDTLKFTVYDYDPLKSDDVLGTATLACDRFYPMGLNLEVQLDNAGTNIRAFLTVNIFNIGPMVAVAPRLNYQDTVVDVYYSEDYAIDVEVDEKIIRKVVKHVPQFVEKEVDVIVEVPEVRHTQELRVEEKWIREEKLYEVTPTKTREVVVPGVVWTENKYGEEQRVDLEVVLPVGERIIERPHVNVDEFVTFTKGKEVVVEIPPSEVHVTCAVPKPRVEIVQPVEYKNEIKEVVVENVHEAVRVIENVQHQTVEIPFPFEQDYTETTKKYVPYFVQQQIDTRMEFVDLYSLNQAVMDAEALLEQLEWEKIELRATLSQAILDLSAKRTLVEDAQSGNRVLEVEINCLRKGAYMLTGSPTAATTARCIHTPERGAHHHRQMYGDWRRGSQQDTRYWQRSRVVERY